MEMNKIREPLAYASTCCYFTSVLSPLQWEREKKPSLNVRKKNNNIENYENDVIWYGVYNKM